eukprot:gene8967-18555_t
MLRKSSIKYYRLAFGHHINRFLTTPSASSLVVTRESFDIDSTYFGADVHYKDAELHRNPIAQHHKQLVNLLSYIPVQLNEIQNRAVENVEKYREDGLTAAKYGGLYLRQITIEDQQHQQAVNEYTEGLQSLLKLGRGTGLKHFKGLLLSWFEPLTKEILREFDLIRNNVTGLDRERYGPCLLLLSAEKLSVITLNTIINMILKSGNGGVRVSQLANEIGSLVKTEINLMKHKLSKEDMPRWQKNLLDVKGDPKRYRALSKHVLKKYDEDWETSINIKVGGALLRFAIEIARDETGLPVLQHKIEYAGNKKNPKYLGVIYLDPTFFEEISMKDLYHVSPRYLPMVVPPKSWFTENLSGGYFRLKANLVRTYSQAQKQAVKEAHMPKVLEGLDYLGSITWRINKDVLRVVKEAWEMGLTIGELPPQHVLPMPTEEECFRVPPKVITPTSTSTSIEGESSDNNNNTTTTEEETSEEQQPVFDEKYYRDRCRRVKKKNSELHSLRCDMQLKFWVADQFIDDNLFFPHNLDFRGRAYPIPPNLSHLGSDLCRGLLMFANTKPLGEEGLRWMKIHLSNLFGHNKISNTDRMEWIESNWLQVLDSGRKPLTGDKWWSTAEEPFQALAVCIDLARAYDSGHPESYCSHIPVHQDGSCNGLQHYAALGRDAPGAKAVNLLPSNSPQDVYTAVLDVALGRMALDAKIPEDCIDNDDRNKGIYARLLQGKVDRKVVKQTVMTSVYGVTRIGARAQVHNRLEEKFKTNPNEILSPEFENELSKASLYLATLTLDSLTEIFSSAKDIMDWLANCAKLVAEEGHTMSWITPLGLPVIQPYRQETSYTVQTLLQKVTLVHSDDVLPVNTMKQRSAFPPNYVHSLDASHMLLTSLKMRDRGLTFAAVHDSYWTHATDVSIMDLALRESFVELYEVPILENLRTSLQRRYPRVDFPPVPTRGSFNVRDVLQSEYFFH